MMPHYPKGWKWLTADVFDSAPLWIYNGRKYDVVSLDPFSNLFRKCAYMAHMWCQLSNRVVIMGSSLATHGLVIPPRGWTKHDPLKRSDFNGGTYWTILERDVQAS